MAGRPRSGNGSGLGRSPGQRRLCARAVLCRSPHHHVLTICSGVHGTCSFVFILLLSAFTQLLTRGCTDALVPCFGLLVLFVTKRRVDDEREREREIRSGRRPRALFSSLHEVGQHLWSISGGRRCPQFLLAGRWWEAEEGDMWFPLLDHAQLDYSMITKGIDRLFAHPVFSVEGQRALV